MTGIEERLIKLMRDKNINKTELAKAIGVSRQAVYSWFLDSDNKRSMSTNNIEKLARIFGVSEQYIKYGVTDNGNVSQLLTVSDCVSNSGQIKFINVVEEDVLLKVKHKYQCDINALRWVKVKDEAMYPMFQEGDRFLIDTTPNQTAKKAGYFLLVGEDSISIRHLVKDVFSDRVMVSCGNASYEDKLLNERQFFEMVKEIYRILLVQREL